jgi:hypothetical protein
MTIKSVGLLSVGKVAGFLYALLGLIIGAFFSLAMVLGGLGAGLASESEGAGTAFGMLFGVGAIVIFPVLYGIMGFIGAIIMALIYNVVAGVVGGIEVDVA